MPSKSAIPRTIGPLLTVAAIALTIDTMAADNTPGVSTGDPMRTEAMPSRLAARSVLVGVTRAGARLIAVGERGHVLISDDQAMNWRQAAVPVRVTLTAVHFVDQRLGWAVGHSGVILGSIDGGSTWQKQLDGAQAVQLIVDAAQASGDATRIEVANRLRHEGPDKAFLDVHFSDAHHGMAVGAYGIAFMTDDGGRHWQPMLDQIPNADERHLYAIHETAEGIYLAGEQGVFFRKGARELKFEAVSTPFRSTVFGVLSASDGTLLAFGLGGKLHRSGDHGSHWESIALANKASLTAGVAGKGRVVLVSEAGQLLLSTDAGRSFKTVADGQPFPAAGAAVTAHGHLVVVGPFGVKALASPSFERN